MSCEVGLRKPTLAILQAKRRSVVHRQEDLTRVTVNSGKPKGHRSQNKASSRGHDIILQRRRCLCSAAHVNAGINKVSMEFWEHQHSMLP